MSGQVRACRRQVDPLVEVSVRDGRSLKTRKVKNNANPEFDEVMNFIVDDPEAQTITAFLREADFSFSKVCTASELFCCSKVVHCLWTSFCSEVYRI